MTDEHEHAMKVADQAYSAGNLVTCDGYYEFDLDAAAAVIAADRAGLVAEIERLWEVAITLHGALAAHTCYGCPACHGDCSSANPPMMFCPTAQARAAYFMFDRAALKDTRNDADA
jgi:predicted lipoprotein with Yx(FWY)xxD motif